MDWSPTVDVILYAVPFFVVFIVLELLSYRYLPDDSPSGGAGRGYETRDTATSLTMGIGSVVINLGWKLVVLAAYTGPRTGSAWATSENTSARTVSRLTSTRSGGGAVVPVHPPKPSTSASGRIRAETENSSRNMDMGGIVARRALNELTLGARRGIEQFALVRLIAQGGAQVLQRLPDVVLDLQLVAQPALGLFQERAVEALAVPLAEVQLADRKSVV